jgi:hypothetical protein
MRLKLVNLKQLKVIMKNEMQDSTDMKEVRRELAIVKLNEIFQMFQLEPVVP